MFNDYQILLFYINNYISINFNINSDNEVRCYDLRDQNNTTWNISSHIQNHFLSVQLISMISMIKELSSTEQY